MSDIVLTAAVRQNLLSLRSTADLLATTQNRLATGKKVNTALDNPTSFFTAQGLDNRAADITGLLDSIGNGVQILQAANTGITALEKLIDNAKSVANQVFQAQVGYSTKSNVTSAAIAGAAVDNLGGAGLDTLVAGSTAVNNQAAAPISTATGLVTAAGDFLNATPTGSLTVNGKTITFDNTAAATTATDAAGNVTISTKAGSTATVQTLLSAIDSITGTSVASTVSAGGALQIHTGTKSDFTLTGAAGTLTSFGLTTVAANGTVALPNALTGLNLTIAATAGGTATNITFGTGPGQVKTLNDLNTKLAANNLQATLSATGAITISTTNDAASATIGAIGGTAAAAGKPFAGLTAGAPVKDPVAQAQRAGLVNAYNDVIAQIGPTAGDANFNGINLLNGDTLKLVFNETGKSTLSITGAVLDPAGLGLAQLAVGTDFLDSSSANTVLARLNNASSILRTQASTLGSNLSIVEIRQDFSKKLVNVLQTGSSNLTLADTNEEAANSQALSTRQSIAVSALALANQSQQSVLQLLQR
jgi:flagellin